LPLCQSGALAFSALKHETNTPAIAHTHNLALRHGYWPAYVAIWNCAHQRTVAFL
jgi:hypothetical protein